MLSEKHTQQQTALWELAETEVAYIKTLKVVTDVSRHSSYVSRKTRLIRVINPIEIIKLISHEMLGT